jgi:hypothetical protein
LRADVAETKHRGAVGQHRDEILAGGIDRSGVGVGRNRLAGKGDAWRIGEREIALIGKRLGGDNLELARPGRAVKLQGVRLEIGCAFLGHSRLPTLAMRETVAPFGRSGQVRPKPP